MEMFRFLLISTSWLTAVFPLIQLSWFQRESYRFRMLRMSAKLSDNNWATVWCCWWHCRADELVHSEYLELHSRDKWSGSADGRTKADSGNKHGCLPCWVWISRELRLCSSYECFQEVADEFRSDHAAIWDFDPWRLPTGTSSRSDRSTCSLAARWNHSEDPSLRRWSYRLLAYARECCRPNRVWTVQAEMWHTAGQPARRFPEFLGWSWTSFRYTSGCVFRWLDRLCWLWALKLIL